MFYSVTAQSRCKIFRIECLPNDDATSFRIHSYESYEQDEEDGEIERTTVQSDLFILSELVSRADESRVETDFGTDHHMRRLQKSLLHLQETRNKRLLDDIIFTSTVRTCYCKRKRMCSLCGTP